MESKTTVTESAIAIGKGWQSDEQFAFIRELKIIQRCTIKIQLYIWLNEDSEENLRDSYKKLTDMEYNMLDSIHSFFIN